MPAPPPPSQSPTPPPPGSERSLHATDGPPSHYNGIPIAALVRDPSLQMPWLPNHRVAIVAYLARHSLSARDCRASSNPPGFPRLLSRLGFDAYTSIRTRESLRRRVRSSLAYTVNRLRTEGKIGVYWTADGAHVTEWPAWAHRWAAPGWDGDETPPPGWGVPVAWVEGRLRGLRVQTAGRNDHRSRSHSGFSSGEDDERQEVHRPRQEQSQHASAEEGGQWTGAPSPPRPRGGSREDAHADRREGGRRGGMDQRQQLREHDQGQGLGQGLGASIWSSATPQRQPSRSQEDEEGYGGPSQQRTPPTTPTPRRNELPRRQQHSIPQPRTSAHQRANTLHTRPQHDDGVESRHGEPDPKTNPAIDTLFPSPPPPPQTRRHGPLGHDWFPLTPSGQVDGHWDLGSEAQQNGEDAGRDGASTFPLFQEDDGSDVIGSHDGRRNLNDSGSGRDFENGSAPAESPSHHRQYQYQSSVEEEEYPISPAATARGDDSAAVLSSPFQTAPAQTPIRNSPDNMVRLLPLSSPIGDSPPVVLLLGQLYAQVRRAIDLSMTARLLDLTLDSYGRQSGGESIVPPDADTDTDTNNIRRAAAAASEARARLQQLQGEVLQTENALCALGLVDVFPAAAAPAAPTTRRQRPVPSSLQEEWEEERIRVGGDNACYGHGHGYGELIGGLLMGGFKY